MRNTVEVQMKSKSKKIHLSFIRSPNENNVTRLLRTFFIHTAVASPARDKHVGWVPACRALERNTKHSEYKCISYNSHI